jgi:hypothetical protein
MIGLLPPISSARIFSGRSANWRLALGRAADQQPRAALGHACLVQAVDHEGAGRGRLFGRLEHYRIARDQRGDDVAVGQMRGEIIRAQHRQHAVRLVAQRHAAAHRGIELALAGAFGEGAGRNVDLGDYRIDLGLGFPQRLAGLARDQVGERVAARADDIGVAAQGLDTEGDRLGRPGGPAFARSRDFTIGIADRVAPQQVAGRRFVGKKFTRHGLRSLAVRRGRRQRLAGQRLTHFADRRDLGMERRPIVAFVDRGPQ